jgi:hypothetical protein
LNFVAKYVILIKIGHQKNSKKGRTSVSQKWLKFNHNLNDHNQIWQWSNHVNKEKMKKLNYLSINLIIKIKFDCEFQYLDQIWLCHDWIWSRPLNLVLHFIMTIHSIISMEFDPKKTQKWDIIFATKIKSWL